MTNKEQRNYLLKGIFFLTRFIPCIFSRTTVKKKKEKKTEVQPLREEQSVPGDNASILFRHRPPASQSVFPQNTQEKNRPSTLYFHLVCHACCSHLTEKQPHMPLYQTCTLCDKRVYVYVYTVGPQQKGKVRPRLVRMSKVRKGWEDKCRKLCRDLRKWWSCHSKNITAHLWLVQWNSRINHFTGHIPLHFLQCLQGFY